MKALILLAVLGLPDALNELEISFQNFESVTDQPALVAVYEPMLQETLIRWSSLLLLCQSGKGSFDLNQEKSQILDVAERMLPLLNTVAERKAFREHIRAYLSVAKELRSDFLDCSGADADDDDHGGGDDGDGDDGDGAGGDGDDGDNEPPPATDPDVDWLVQPSRVIDVRTGGIIQSQEPIQDLIGADQWSSSAKNRESMFVRGDLVEVAPGEYPHFRVTLSTDLKPGRTRAEGPEDVSFGRDPQTILRASRPGTVFIKRNPTDGSQTLYLEWGGGFTFEGFVFQGDDLMSVTSERPASDRFEYHQGFRDFRFFNCAVAGGWNAETGQGPKNKWGILNYEMGRSAFDGPGWVWVGGHMEGIFEEHFHYFHNVQGDILIAGNSPEDPLTAKWSGRTFFQMANRISEGPKGVGNLTFRDIEVEDTGLEAGGGGSAFSFHGRHQGTILLERVKVRLGANRQLGYPWNQNITGALVVFAGGDSQDQPNGDVIVQDCDFQVGPFYTGEGAARRTNVDVQGCQSFTLMNTRIAQLGKNPATALSINSALVRQRIVLDDDNDITGECGFDGRKYPTYAAMLEAVASHPKVEIR